MKKIEAIGPCPEIKIPDKTLVIDGTNKFPMPGLVDMHAHVECYTEAA